MNARQSVPCVKRRRRAFASSIPDEEPWEAEALARKLVVVRRAEARGPLKWGVFEASGPHGGKRY